MVAKKPRIVIVGAGMAGLTAANQLYTSTGSNDMFELCVVEGGTRIGGRINTSEFGGDRIEMGATWIHGIGGSPVHEIAQAIHSLESDQPWECMDGFLDEPKTVAEGGLQVDPSLVESTSTLFKNLMDYAQGKPGAGSSSLQVQGLDLQKIAAKASRTCTSISNGGCGGGGGGEGKLSVGSFLGEGINAYWECLQGQREEVRGCENWSRKSLEQAIFAIHENTQRTYTSAGDLMELDFDAESEYRMFPGEEITIAKGYISIIESLASVLPRGLIQLGRKVEQIEWQPKPEAEAHPSVANGHTNRPVKLHFCDGSVMEADHVIVTVSLGVLKAGIGQGSGNMFSPPLPHSKVDAISRLGYGVVNKLFLQLSTNGLEEKNCSKFPLLQLAFHRPDSDLRLKQIPWWMRKTASLCPIYKNSSVLLSWFAGEEAHELESLPDEEIIEGVSTTLSCFTLAETHQAESPNSDGRCNGSDLSPVRFTNVLKTKWGSDPLFLGSYSYIAVGSSGEDIDTLAEPLPKIGCEDSESGGSNPSLLQVLFAGEATHRTHYSTTHGAYFSGLREANRLLQYYHCL